MVQAGSRRTLIAAVASATLIGAAALAGPAGSAVAGTRSARLARSVGR